VYVVRRRGPFKSTWMNEFAGFVEVQNEEDLLPKIVGN
jgi:hypothetical protein